MSDEETLPAITEAQDVSVMQMLNNAVKDPQFDADKLEKLIALKERVDATEAKRAFNDAMYRFHSDPPRVVKNKPVYGKDVTKGPQYHHADFADAVKVIRPALLEVGIVATWSSEPMDNGVTRVTCMLRHTMGHEEKSTMAGTPEVGGSKNAIQGVGSSDSYLRRYTLLSVTGIVAEGEDNDGNQAIEYINEAQQKQITELAEMVSADMAGYLKFLKVPHISAIQPNQFKHAIASLEKKRKK